MLSVPRIESCGKVRVCACVMQTCVCVRVMQVGEQLTSSAAGVLVVKPM